MPAPTMMTEEREGESIMPLNRFGCVQREREREREKERTVFLFFLFCNTWRIIAGVGLYRFYFCGFVINFFLNPIYCCFCFRLRCTMDSCWNNVLHLNLVQQSVLHANAFSDSTHHGVEVANALTLTFTLNLSFKSIININQILGLIFFFTFKTVKMYL